MASEQMESKATPTKSQHYEKQLEALWKGGGSHHDETDDQGQGQGQGQMHKQSAQGNTPQLQGLPLESSPYVKYTDLEDYKRQAYGTQGHLEPKPHPQIGTDAPTLDGVTNK